VSAVGHCLTLVKGSRDYHAGQPPYRPLPLLTGTCSCGGWTREVHRFDADSDEYKALVRADHHIHATVLTATPSWPEDANDLHPLLGGWHGDLVTGEHARHHVPLEAGGLAKGTTYLQLTDAISEELDAALGEDDDVVPLERAPRLAAAIALTQQLTRNWPKVECWRVMVRQPNEPHPFPGKDPEGWCYLACQTQEQAEAYRPWVEGYLNRDRKREDDPYRYVATVDLGPAEINRLRVPGRMPEQDYELRQGRPS